MENQTVNITLTGAGLQEQQNLDIQVSITSTVNVTAKAAKRRATAWLVSEVGNMLVGSAPHLVISRERTTWRVPILLTSAMFSMVGEVGVVEVDAESGHLLVSDLLREQIFRTYAVRRTSCQLVHFMGINQGQISNLSYKNCLLWVNCVSHNIILNTGANCAFSGALKYPAAMLRKTC